MQTKTKQIGNLMNTITSLTPNKIFVSRVFICQRIAPLKMLPTVSICREKKILITTQSETTNDTINKTPVKAIQTNTYEIKLTNKSVIVRAVISRIMQGRSMS